MNPASAKQLHAYREWSISREYRLCRLVHYCGVDLVGAKNVPHAEIETEIEQLTNEGFSVDWRQDGNRLTLCVWEYGGPTPDWELVINERALADIDAILKRSRE